MNFSSEFGGFKSDVDMADAGEMQFLQHNRISQHLNPHHEAIKKVATIDLSMVKMKMCLPIEKEGDGWTKEKTDQVEIWYRRFLVLGVLYPKTTIVPTTTIDKMWHRHILDTLAYYEDCMRVFGRIFHHYPYLGLRGKKDAERLQGSFNITLQLYLQHFGSTPIEEATSACWNNCGNGTNCSNCGHGK